MIYLIILFFTTVNLLAEKQTFKPLSNRLFFTIMALLILSKVLIGKFVRNRVKKEEKKNNDD